MVYVDYTLDIDGDLMMPKYTELAVAMFESNTAAVENHMDDFVELVQWLKGKLDGSLDLRRFGDKDMSDHHSLLFDVLRDLLNIVIANPLWSGIRFGRPAGCLSFN